MPLEKETAYFERKRDEWLEHHHEKWALVVEEELVGVFDTFENAFEAGVEKFGNRAMLIRQVLREDEEVPNQNIAYDLGLLNAHL